MPSMVEMISAISREEDSRLRIAAIARLAVLSTPSALCRATLRRALVWRALSAAIFTESVKSVSVREVLASSPA